MDLIHLSLLRCSRSDRLPTVHEAKSINPQALRGLPTLAYWRRRDLMISTAFCWPFWLCCYLLWPELITGTPPQQFNTAVITRLGVPDSVGLRCPLWVRSSLSSSYHPTGRFRVQCGRSRARRAFITGYLASWMEQGHGPLLGMAGHPNRSRCRISIHGNGETCGLSEIFPSKTSIDCR